MIRKLRRQQRLLFWTLLVVFNILVIFTFLRADQRRAVWLGMAIPGMSTKGGHNGTTNGYKLAKYVKEQCVQNGFYYPLESVRLNQIYSTKSNKLQLCPIWKVGTTFLKRLFMIENIKIYERFSNPYSISFKEQYDGEKGDILNTDNNKRFMFARNPYQRLLSCYVDKLLAPNPVYWRIIGIPAIKATRKEPSQKDLMCGHDLTFSEFIQHVIISMDSSRRGIIGRPQRKVGVLRDLHFEQLTVVCKPCHIKYDFVGKLESFREDSLELIKQMNLTNVETLIKSSDDKLAAEDAIKDTVDQPFQKAFRNDFLNCISVKEALERAWTKLKVRGLIGRQYLNFTEEDARRVTHEQFLNLALKARQQSTKYERKSLKREWYYEMYESVAKTDLEKISRIYQDDFKLFDYDSRPKDLFGK